MYVKLLIFKYSHRENLSSDIIISLVSVILKLACDVLKILLFTSVKKFVIISDIKLLICRNEFCIKTIYVLKSEKQLLCAIFYRYI